MKKVPMPKVLQRYQWFRQGADPELFLSLNGEIVGSERYIPEDHPTVKRDGVQVELHPAPKNCRQELTANLAGCIKDLKDILLRAKDPVVIDWRAVVEVSQDEMNRLSELSKVLGCQPSFNVYDPAASVEVDPNYRIRSAGGHIHLEMNSQHGLAVLHRDPTEMVKLLDTLLGTVNVLLDREPRAAERREVYGRAGEFRLPSYGIEYRTLSNWWLRSDVTVSMVYALARFAGYLWQSDRGASLLSRVDETHVRDSINENSFEKAWQTYEVLHDYMKDLIKACAPFHIDQHSYSQQLSYALTCLPEEKAHMRTFATLGVEKVFGPHHLTYAETAMAAGNIKGWEKFMKDRLPTLAAEFPAVATKAS
jgi:hypothetical protein